MPLAPVFRRVRFLFLAHPAFHAHNRIVETLSTIRLKNLQATL
jgi:hypothetical protein